MVERIRSKKYQQQHAKANDKANGKVNGVRHRDKQAVADGRSVAERIYAKPPSHAETGQYQKRHAMKAGPGRPKGIPNKMTSVLKEAVLLAAEAHGYDGKGQDKLFGFCLKVAEDDLKTFVTSLLSKVMPLQIAGKTEVEVMHVSQDQLDRLKQCSAEELRILERVFGGLVEHSEQRLLPSDNDNASDGNGVVIDNEESADADDYEDTL